MPHCLHQKYHFFSPHFNCSLGTVNALEKVPKGTPFSAWTKITAFSFFFISVLSAFQKKAGTLNSNLESVFPAVFLFQAMLMYVHFERTILPCLSGWTLNTARAAEQRATGRWAEAASQAIWRKRDEILLSVTLPAYWQLENTSFLEVACGIWSYIRYALLKSNS